MGTATQRCVAVGLACLAAAAFFAATRTPAQPAASAQQAAGSSPAAASPTQSPNGAPQTAAQRFKNIQVLKDIPADQLIPSMQFVAASLGVDCEFCHVEHANDKDDKKPKLIARKMMTMMMQINADNFKGEREVTCYSCHRGSIHPIATPILSAHAPARPGTGSGGPSGAPSATVSATSELPSAQSILEKYLAAAGGATAIEAVKTRKQSGYLHIDDQIEPESQKFPITIYSEGPDKRVSSTHMGTNDSITAYNGKVGWLTTPVGVRPMNAQETQAASIDAQLYFPVRLPQLYQDFKVEPGEVIDGKQTYLVLANGKDQPPLSLYFDQDSGLLVRQLRYTETALGRLPTQIDYADYREDGDVTIPYRWTLARVNGRFTIEIELVKENLPIDENVFVMPPPTPPRQGGPGGPPGHDGPPPAH
ncbi:MAG: c-type cytochrome [Candidatus Acidiferrales bacterium]